MPRIKHIICSGVCFLIWSVTTAQSLPKNPTIQQVVNYQVYQQKKWNYDQLPKNSIQYRSDPKYIQLSDRKISSAKFNLHPVATPDIKKSFSAPTPALHTNSKTYLQRSRFLKYMWPDQKQRLEHSL